MSPVEWALTFPHNRVELAIGLATVFWTAKQILESFTGGVYSG